VKTEPKEDHPVLVFEETMLSGQARPGHAEPSIWTEGMLIALGNGVQGGKWYSLGDKSFSVKALDAAFTKVKSNAGVPGVDGWTVERFDSDRQGQIARMHEALMEGTYSPKPVRRVWIPKPGTNEKRPLGIPTVRDRVVQTCLRGALDPIFEREFRGSSYGFRPGRSCKQALHKVWLALKAGKQYVVDADLKRFFDTIPHEVILSGLKEKVTDGKILGLVSAYLWQGVMSEGLLSPEDEAEVGTPQGSPLSPLLANIALHGLDVLVEESGFEIVRYADDFVILCQTMVNAEAALEAVRDWTVRHGLELHPGKTRIVDYGSGESFEFLGFEFRKDRVFPRKKSIKKLRDNIRNRTPRCSGKSLYAVIASLNPVLRGWFQYFKESPEHVFRGADEFVRRRLRAMLAKRNRKRLYHAGLSSSKRWPNAYFAECGLYSMQNAHKDRSILSKAKH
jgi:RNA-directed DNA polymerase